MQYLFPRLSGKLWPKCVPSRPTASPSFKTLIFSLTISSSLKLGHPWSLLSLINYSYVRPLGAINKGFPVTVS